MSLIAEFTLGHALVTVASIFLFVVWFWILITIIGDLFNDHDSSGWAKAAWIFVLIFAPFVGAFVYLIIRGQGMSERALARQKEAKAQFDSYVRETAGTTPADELNKLSDLHEKGALSDEEFASAKAKLLT